jgi:hypothetical protein
MATKQPIQTPPSQSFLERQSQIGVPVSNPSPTYVYTPRQKSPIGLLVLLTFIFITNILIVALLALLLAKTWLVWELLGSVVNGDNSLAIYGSVDVGYVEHTVTVQPVN